MGQYKWTFSFYTSYYEEKTSKDGRGEPSSRSSEDVSLAKLERDVFHSVQLFSRCRSPLLQVSIMK